MRKILKWWHRFHWTVNFVFVLIILEIRMAILVIPHPHRNKLLRNCLVPFNLLFSLLRCRITGKCLCWLVFHCFSEKTDKTMGCLDPSGGRKLFCRFTASWQGNTTATLLPIFIWKQMFFFFFPAMDVFWQWNTFSRQNFEKITSRVQSKNKDQVI